jgi:pyridoxamine 5'-phosphate oxidase
MNSLADIRREYNCDSLNRNQLEADPFRQMHLWLDQAKQAELKDATAMTLATSDHNNLPDARIVLLKQLDERGFCWYTDYSSHKGQQLADNPQACLLFHWRELDRQVRVQGRVEKINGTEADQYFASRPLQSRLSAAASSQSQAIDSRAELEAKVAQLQQQYDDHVPRPADWGGYRLLPARFEFWQGRENRLHDRFNYEKSDNGNHWLISRLQP